MSKKTQRKFFRHEALHTTHLIRDMLYEYVIKHPYLDSNINPEFKKYILNAERELAKAYQAVGDKVHETGEISDEYYQSI